MFGIGMPELIVILIIALLIFGATRLPQIGKGLGQGIREFKKAMKAVSEEPEDETKKVEKKKGE
ncbi:MAG: twin-arginine translocase TatA/TatE family subunit [bacterium]